MHWILETLVPKRMQEPLVMASRFLWLNRRGPLIITMFFAIFGLAYYAQVPTIEQSAFTVFLILLVSQIPIWLLGSLTMWSTVDIVFNGVVLFCLVCGYWALDEQAGAQTRLATLIENCSCSNLTKQG